MEWTDALIVRLIVLVTVAIDYRREYGAEAATTALRARVLALRKVLAELVMVLYVAAAELTEHGFYRSSAASPSHATTR